MTVYVDELRPTPRSARWPYDQACHMTADSHEELMEIAGRMRLSRSWLQGAGKWHEHFDLTPAMRAQAVNRHGAVEVRGRERVKQMRPDLFPPDTEAPAKVMSLQAGDQCPACYQGQLRPAFLDPARTVVCPACKWIGAVL